MKSSERPRRVIVVGGGAAGWISACLMRAYLIQRGLGERCQVTLVESPDVQTLGVGEGSWPSLRQTLRKIGVEEAELMRRCAASFKQGSRFIDWRAPGHVYDHPFHVESRLNSVKSEQLLEAFYAQDERPFASFVSPQPAVCDRALAPKSPQALPFEGELSYGYHLDSDKLTELLAEHGVARLGVVHRKEHIERVELGPEGEISTLWTRARQRLSAELFVDCSGSRGLLIKQTLQSPWRSVREQLLNNSALATQAPYSGAQQPILSMTHATAFEAGWIWDICLANRRGVGVVYSDEYADQALAQQALERYLTQRCGLQHGSVRSLSTRSISFEPGYHEACWVKNCVAIGQSAGFVEPLEASALMLVEKNATALAKAISVQELRLDESAQLMNQVTSSLWDHLVRFLKLHYALSERRDSAYWRAQRDRYSWPRGLSELVSTLQSPHPPLRAALRGSPFSAFSYLCVSLGMGSGQARDVLRSEGLPNEELSALISELKGQKAQLMQRLLSNRDLLNYYQ